MREEEHEALKTAHSEHQEEHQKSLKSLKTNVINLEAALEEKSENILLYQFVNAITHFLPIVSATVELMACITPMVKMIFLVLKFNPMPIPSQLSVSE